ncbi:M16 family metallopeptidase [Streptomyces roseifaciens]|uniref:M16 family metallopeptidase n=1 Tax=Streptomyces roseifaciens TaxID=1488406 RepID=UPI000717DF9E|nr:pitrilysin family protein [Streptomyces roseifaciens]
MGRVVEGLPAVRPAVLAHRLDNGLHLTVEPDPGPGRGLVAVALTVAAGGDHDPAGRHGMAHLVEHLMFPRGTDAGPDADPAGGPDGHAGRVEGAGGMCNAETHRDHTVFHTVAPADAFPGILEGEARRLLEFAPSDAAVRTETEIIGEEIRGAVGGGRLWDTAYASLHPGSRDAYGTVAELRHATAAEAVAFHRAHYTAGAMALTVVGDVDAARVAERVGELFGGVPAGPARRGATPTAAPAAAGGIPYAVSGVALAHALPDAVRERHAYLAHVVLAELMGRGRLSRAVRADARQRLTAASIHCGYYGQWLATAAPDLAMVLLGRSPGTGTGEAVDAWQEVLRETADTPPTDVEHRRAVNALLVNCHRNADSLTARAVAHGRAALLFPGDSGPGNGPDALPEQLARVTPADVAAAARRLLTAPYGVTELVGGTQ